MQLCDLIEAIHAPYAIELRDLLLRVARRSKAPDEARVHLQALMQDYVERQLPQTDLQIEFLVIPTDSGFGGFFRAPGDYIGAAGEYDLPPLPPDTMQIALFASPAQLEGLLRQDHHQLQRMTGVIQHEMVHAQQYIRSGGKPRALVHMISGRSRPTIAGKRVGKRGGAYDPQNMPQYLSQGSEIEAMAAQAASDMITRVRAEAPERQRKVFGQMLRGLQGDSPTLVSYREWMARPEFTLSRSMTPVQKLARRRVRRRVWNMFRLKLAKHLMTYLPELPA